MSDSITEVTYIPWKEEKRLRWGGLPRASSKETEVLELERGLF